MAGVSGTSADRDPGAGQPQVACSKVLMFAVGKRDLSGVVAHHIHKSRRDLRIDQTTC